MELEILNIKIPSAPTLKKYGLSVEEFSEIWRHQGSKCPICNRVPTTGRVNIDHHHVPKWKSMPDHQRKMYVRGVTCWWCNKMYLAKGISVEKAQNVVKYLQDGYALKAS